MAELSWPSPDNGRAVDESQYEQLSAHNTEDGFYMDPNGVFIDTAGGPVYADSSSPRNVKIRANKYANVRGFGYHSGASDVQLSIDANTSGSTRIDWVVLELDRATWNVRAKIVKGTAGTGVPPALTRDEGATGVFQVPVATVNVANNASVIGAANVVVTGHRVGSRIRAWLKAADMSYPKLGEIGFDNTTKGWFGWNGTGRINIANDTGWVNLTTNGADGGAWSENVLNRIRKKNGIVHMRLAIKRWADSGLGTADTDGSRPITLPTQFRPDQTEFGVGFHGRSPAAFQVESSGTVRVYPLTTEIPANRTVFCSMQWILD